MPKALGRNTLNTPGLNTQQQLCSFISYRPFCQDFKKEKKKGLSPHFLSYAASVPCNLTVNQLPDYYRPTFVISCFFLVIQASLFPTHSPFSAPRENVQRQLYRCYFFCARNHLRFLLGVTVNRKFSFTLTDFKRQKSNTCRSLPLRIIYAVQNIHTVYIYCKTFRMCTTMLFLPLLLCRTLKN